jgi:hypothetical protein
MSLLDGWSCARWALALGVTKRVSKRTEDLLEGRLGSLLQRERDEGVVSHSTRARGAARELDTESNTLGARHAVVVPDLVDTALETPEPIDLDDRGPHVHPREELLGAFPSLGDVEVGDQRAGCGFEREEVVEP